MPKKTDIEKVKEFINEMQCGWYPLNYINGLYQCSFNINSQDENGNTFWHYNTDVCPDKIHNQNLLKDFCEATGQQIDLSVKNNKGVSVLGSLIANTSNPFIFEDVLRYSEFYKSIDYTAQNENGISMLMCYIPNGDNNLTFIKEICEEHPEIINLQNGIGNTALHYACHHYPSIAVVQLLLQNGADKSIQNSEGKRPIDVVKDKEIKRLLSHSSPELIVKGQVRSVATNHSNSRVE